MLGQLNKAVQTFSEAIEFTKFGNMKKLEAADAFDSKILHTRDKQDPESANVRRGKVGGFTDYLSLEDQAFAAEQMSALDPRFGYQAK